jgi:hypothetical protein
VKDIFIDNNVASRFSRPADEEYKKLLRWLLEYNEEPEKDAYLVVSKKLEEEYIGSSQHALSTTSIPYIVEILRRQDRLNFFEKTEIDAFLQTYSTKQVRKKLRGIKKDWNHLAIVMLSDRKMAITIDDDFAYNLYHFPGFTTIVSKRPENLDYKGENTEGL